MHCNAVYHDQITVLDIFRAASAKCKPFFCLWAKLDRSQQQINFVRFPVRVTYLSVSLSPSTRYAQAKSLPVVHSLRTSQRRCGLRPNMFPHSPPPLPPSPRLFVGYVF